MKDISLFLFIFLFGFSLNLSYSNRKNLPKRVMIGYWQNWGDPFIKLRDVCQSWDIINIAFAVPITPNSSDGKMKFDTYFPSDYSVTDFISDIKILQSKGKRIVLSIGGATGPFTLGNGEAVNQFIKDISYFIDTYGFNGIDIDLEQHSTDFNAGNDPDIRSIKTPILSNLAFAIKALCTKYGSEFILSWAPETMYSVMGYYYYGGIQTSCDKRQGSFLPLINSLRQQTTFVHTQLYNSGSVLAPDGKIYDMGTINGTVAMTKMMMDGFYVAGGSGIPKTESTYFAPLRQDQVVIGVPATNEIREKMKNSDLQEAFKQLVKDYPNVRGFMAWSINLDHKESNDSFAIENRKFLDNY